MCTLWLDLISGDKRLTRIKNCFDPYQQVRVKSHFGSRGSGEGQFNYPCGICSFLDKIIVCDAYNHRIQIFDKDGQFLHMFGSHGSDIGKFIGPKGVCIVDGNLWIADCSNQRVQIFDSSNFQFVNSVSLEGLYPCAIWSGLKDLILVVSEEGKVLILDRHGHIIKMFDCKGGNIYYPTGICSNSRNEIIVSNHCNASITVFSKSGVFLRRLGLLQGQTVWGRKTIWIDSEDNIYVSNNGSNEISILTMEGILINQIPIADPNGICMMGRNLIVTSTNDLVHILSN